MHTDFDCFFRNRIETLLIRASWVETLRAILGLQGVSQVWEGNAAWYFWLGQAPGVYALVFSTGDEIATNGRRMVEGHFALKCYPYPDHPGFAGFSPEERDLIRSDRFDATHTPRFEAAAEIPEPLFTIGSLSLLCDLEGDPALLTYQSLDALRLYRISAVPGVLHPDTGAPDAGRLVRDVAGWSLGYPLFDCLVGLFAHSTRRPPAFVGAARCSGFEYAVFADGSAACRPSCRSTQTTLTIGFHSAGAGPDRMKSLWREGLEAGEEIQAVRRLPVSIDDSVGRDLPEGITLNPLWWEIAESDFKSELTSTCGCGKDHCHHIHPQDGP